MGIRPDEISNIIKNQIKNYKAQTDERETGTVITVGDGIVRAFGLENCMANELVRFEGGEYGMAMNLEEETDRLAPINGLMPDPTNLPEGCPFHPRCPYADEDCKKPQVVRNISDSHYVRCGAYDRPGFHIERKER